MNRYGLGDADDLAAVLRHRLRLATSDAGSRRIRRPARLIAGLIPEPIGPMAADIRKAIDERKVLIEQRAKTLAETGIKRRESWIQRIGDAPAVDRIHWLRSVIAIAAYRDRHGITSRDPLGGQPVDDNQRLDRARAEAALRRATEASTRLASQETWPGTTGPWDLRRCERHQPSGSRHYRRRLPIGFSAWIARSTAGSSISSGGSPTTSCATSTFAASTAT